MHDHNVYFMLFNSSWMLIVSILKVIVSISVVPPVKMSSETPEFILCIHLAKSQNIYIKQLCP